MHSWLRTSVPLFQGVNRHGGASVVSPDPSVMTHRPFASDAVTLENCESEPIHIPGAIQPLGALLAFGSGRTVCYASENAQEVLGVDLALGERLDDDALPRGLHDALMPWLDGAEPEFEPFVAILRGQAFDVVGHRNDDEITIVEFERCAVQPGSITASLTRAYRTIEKLRRQKSVESVLSIAVHEIRNITGFDRVMAYRFRPDDSGEIVRESRREDLDDWEGRRYPATDIPAQARRLYIRNTLRLIADADYVPVPVRGAVPGKPLDMSSCVLRSVSPIHIEYLQNMGVRASMSISIVIDGRLWGMIACHHFSPCQVAFGVRMACEVMAQVLSSMAAGFESKARATRALSTAALVNRIALRATESEDLLKAVGTDAPSPAELLSCDAMICVWGGGVAVCSGIAPRGDILRILQALDESGHRVVVCNNVGAQYPGLRSELVPYCGFLACKFDSMNNGWLIWLRKEQIDTVVWGGKPEKQYRVGPRGPRLTPRGSFEAWRDDVRDTTPPWLVEDIEAAQTLRDELAQIAESRTAELDRARTALLAMLGHDLRDPLHSISMAATLLTRTGTQSAQMGERIRTSSSRMQRLISQVLDLSRLQGGLGLGMQPQDCDLSSILAEMVDESRMAQPNLVLRAEIEPNLRLQADPDRMAQVFGNLLSNARKHGKPGCAIEVEAWREADSVQVRVSNDSEPIPADLMEHLFSPFKPGSIGRSRNRSGLGLGLYIADQVIKGHSGGIVVQCTEGKVHFLVSLPIATGTAAAPQ